MNRIAITGAGGRMGKALIDAILLNDGAELTVALERPESSLVGVECAGKTYPTFLKDFQSLGAQIEELL